uniref:Dihydroflavonol-4-reductase n=1 Tax=Anthurium amnicola TaxID=1678845 RepID=A0A1D1YJA6_9ARAE
MRLCKRWRRGILLSVALVLFLPFLLSVSELHRSLLLKEESRGEGKKKLDRLVFGPAAGQGLPDRLQCHGLKALNKTHHSTLSQTRSVMDNIAFITVFTIYNTSRTTHYTSSDKVTVGNASYNKVEKFMAILHTYIDFIQVAMPHSDVIILTDPASAFSIRKSNTAILPIKGDYSRGNLMLQRIKSYIAFLETRLKGLLEMPKQFSHYIFTDSDIAVVDDLGHIFQNYPRFHLALTFRNNKDQPINSGFIAVRGTRDGILGAKTFLQRVLEVYSSKYMKASRMLGDQLALAWIVKSQISLDTRKFAKPKPFEDEIHGTAVLFLPCAVYNWTPPEGAGQFHGMPLDLKVVHFKGSRKRLMLESWNFLNSSSSNLSDMLCLILASGRTKYDF